MKKRKTIVSLLLTAALCFGLLTGCSTVQPSVPGPAPSAQVSLQSGNITPSAENSQTPDVSPSSAPPSAPPVSQPPEGTPSPSYSPSPAVTQSPSASPTVSPSQAVSPSAQASPSPSPLATITDPTSPLAPSSPKPSAPPSPSPPPASPLVQTSPYPVQSTPDYTSELYVSASGTSEIEVGCRNDGYVKIHYTGTKKIVVQIYYETDARFDNFVGTGEGWYSVPLTYGDRTYTVRVMENSTGNGYRQIQKLEISVKLKSQHSPYLVPSYQVNYTSDSKTAKKARELVAGLDGDLARAEAIFKYIVTNYVYDNDKASDVRSGKITSSYKPVVDVILDAKKGICYDYAALYASMLRSVGIPAKMIIGEIPEGRHAWNEVYISGTGWIKINGDFFFDGKKYTRMDSTWAAVNKDGRFNDYFRNDSNYTDEETY